MSPTLRLIGQRFVSHADTDSPDGLAFRYALRNSIRTSYANGLTDLPFTFDDGNDTFASGGGAGNLLWHMGKADDYVLAGRNNDQVFGEAGNDTLFGNSADDRLSGGIGNDVLAGDNDDASIVDGNDLLDWGDGEIRWWAAGGEVRLSRRRLAIVGPDLSPHRPIDRHCVAEVQCATIYT